jgi:hypothetical protein
LAIYRGAGGSGDATQDAASEVLLALAAKDAAIAAQAAAEAAQVAAELAETNAELAETNAETAETNAETAETNAETAQAAAASSASAASTSATNAAASASTATTQATNAASSASSASTSASNASTSASAASTSASNAATAQSAAESARDATLAAYDSFDDRYLGAKSSAPTLDNDGNALVGGALYFDTVSQGMKVYTGSAWVDAYVPGSTYLAKANNLSDLTNTSTARTNLGVAIGTDVLSPSGSGASLTALNATNISSGTLGSARLPAFSGDATSTIGTSALTLATVNSNTGSFGSSSAVPVITVNGKGLITAVTTAAVSGSISVTGGDLTLSGNTGTAITNATLATVNSNTGSFGSSSSIPVITVNGKGLITAVTTSAVAGGQYFGTAAVKAIAYNASNIDENITMNYNGMSVGAITIGSGFSVTVNSGVRWVIL